MYYHSTIRLQIVEILSKYEFGAAYNSCTSVAYISQEPKQKVITGAAVLLQRISLQTWLQLSEMNTYTMNLN